MGSLTNAAEVDILKLLTHQTASIFPLSAGPFLALYTTAPGESSGGTEVTGGSYARVDTSAKWGAPSAADPSTVGNNAVLAFPAPSGADFGHVIGIGLLTASTGGTLLEYYAHDFGTILDGDPAPQANIGDIVLTLD